MIVIAILNVIVGAIAQFASLFGAPVTHLPLIGGYDIDATLTTNIGYVYRFFYYVWVLGDVMLGALFLWGYYAAKVMVRTLLGHRGFGHA